MDVTAIENGVEANVTEHFSQILAGPMQLLAAEGATTNRSLLEYIRAGGFVGYCILIVSVLAVALTVAHLIQAQKKRMAPPEIVEQLSRLVRANDVRGAMELCAVPENRSFLTGLFGSALQRCLRSPFGFLEIRSALEEAGQREMERMLKPVEGLAIIAAVGPMMGLLGTVFGMIGAFASIGNLKGAERSQELAQFMSLALVTTAEGLMVAIPATIAYSMFRRRLDRLATDVAAIADDLASVLESGGQSVRPAAARPGMQGAASAAPAQAAASSGPAASAPVNNAGNAARGVPAT